MAGSGCCCDDCETVGGFAVGSDAVVVVSADGTGADVERLVAGTFSEVDVVVVNVVSVADAATDDVGGGGTELDDVSLDASGGLSTFEPDEFCGSF